MIKIAIIFLTWTHHNFAFATANPANQRSCIDLLSRVGDTWKSDTNLSLSERLRELFDTAKVNDGDLVVISTRFDVFFGRVRFSQEWPNRFSLIGPSEYGYETSSLYRVGLLKVKKFENASQAFRHYLTQKIRKNSNFTDDYRTETIAMLAFEDVHRRVVHIAGKLVLDYDKDEIVLSKVDEWAPNLFPLGSNTEVTIPFSKILKFYDIPFVKEYEKIAEKWIGLHNALLQMRNLGSP